jgi:carboxyl-terminal processing protease
VRRAFVGIAAGVVVLVATEGRAQAPEISPPEWRVLAKAVRLVRREYVAPVDDQRLARGCARRVHALPAMPPAPEVTALTDVPVVLRAAVAAAPSVTPRTVVGECLAGMLESLDAYSSFVPADEWRESMSGVVAGTGLELALRDQAVVVVDVIDGSPAAAAGVRAGDRVAAVAGRSVDGLKLSDVTRKLRGRTGSAVVVTIARGAEVLELTLTRSMVRASTVTARVIEPAILHLGVRRLEERTLGDIDAVVAPLLARIDTTPRALLLDLRDDGGGLFRAAIDLAGGLLPPGALVGTLEGRRPEARRRFAGERGWAREAVAEWLGKVPMAVLVNGATASGAEIVVAALQGHGRAAVLGTPTAGLGSIQTVLSLDDGSYLRLTTAVWLTPRGEPLEGRPITPDVLLVTGRGPAPGGRPFHDAVLEQAVEVLKTRRTAPQ